MLLNLLCLLQPDFVVSYDIDLRIHTVCNTCSVNSDRSESYDGYSCLKHIVDVIVVLQ